MVGGKPPVVPEILGQIDPSPSKSANCQLIFAPIASAVTSAKTFYTVSRKKETKMFSVIARTNLGRCWRNVATVSRINLLENDVNVFHFTWIMSLHYRVKLEMLTVHALLFAVTVSVCSGQWCLFCTPSLATVPRAVINWIQIWRIWGHNWGCIISGVFFCNNSTCLVNVSSFTR